MEKNYYNCIYMYTNKINGKRYVGKAQDFNKRHKEHLRGKKQLIDKKIKEYGIENFDIEILKEDLTDDEMNYWEDYYIKNFDLYVKHGKGYNIAKGGIGGNLLEGKTEEEKQIWKDKIGASQKGKCLTEETKKRIGDALSYKIIQYSKDGCFIKEWNSMMDIQRELGFLQSKICLVCQYYYNPEKFLENNNGHSRLSAYGYLWKYKTDNKDVEKYNDTRTKKISQYTKDGELIKTWNSFKEITNELGINRKEIYNVCNGKRKSARGFIWKYAD